MWFIFWVLYRTSTHIESDPAKNDPLRQFHLSLYEFTNPNSFFALFFYNKKNTVFHWPEENISSFPQHFQGRNQSLRDHRWYAMPSTSLMPRRRAVHWHKEFRWSSSCIIDVPNRIRLTTISNGKTEIKTDFVSNINETMLFALNPNQLDGWYCVRFRSTHIWSLSSLTESFSDRMQIFLAPPNDCFSNWDGFVIVESFHVSTAYPHTHRNPNPHPHLNHPQRANNNCLFFLLSLYFFRRKKKRCVCSRTQTKFLEHVGKKSIKQSTNRALCWLLIMGFFSFAIKISIVNESQAESTLVDPDDVPFGCYTNSTFLRDFWAKKTRAIIKPILKIEKSLLPSPTGLRRYFNVNWNEGCGWEQHPLSIDHTSVTKIIRWQRFAMTQNWWNHKIQLSLSHNFSYDGNIQSQWWDQRVNSRIIPRSLFHLNHEKNVRWNLEFEN